jgi:molybdopterin/thiamine biosynthesis adenylyltransferase
MKPPIHIIGCGGVASHILMPLLQTAEFALQAPTIFLWDGDTFEPNNCGRQFLAHAHNGRNKAEAFADHYAPLYKGEVVAVPRWFTGQECVEDKYSTLICAVDNHAGRRNVRAAVKSRRCIMFSAANETNSGEAWVLRHDFCDTAADPFIRYPDLALDVGRDPAGPAGCMSDAAITDNPQLPAGNFSAAALCMWLIAGNLCGRNPKSDLNPAEARFSRNGIFSKRYRDFIDEAAAVAA